jgi:hypothetical protein
MSVQSKSKRKSHLKPDLVMTLFLHDIVAIRNLTTRIQEVDRQLAQEFGRFNRISESIEKENNQILDLLLEPVFRSKQLAKARLQQQRDIARSFGTEERIGSLLEARSDAISDLVQRQYGLGKVR